MSADPLVPSPHKAAIGNAFWYSETRSLARVGSGVLFVAGCRNKRRHFNADVAVVVVGVE
ncbi:hypothetical protein [Variovorax sp. dw_308]|uniref:hypothetical protein n=1 Tax=Variovorax sp. dw_308 TaxID=2721546 RepID=UPI001C449E40|nr:hypothetical protein [Variovorax sp. dw_308]